MARYWFKCEDCNKRIKKKHPNFEGTPLCHKCNTNRRKRNCIFCGKEYIPHSSFGKRGKKANFCSSSCSSKYNLTGRKLSKEHKENLSKAAWNNKGNGYSKIKYYKIFCPYLNKEISVQGTYELKYAQYLNDQNINWERGRKVNFKYKRTNDDITRNYYPDFYLVDKKEYIEIKGYFSDKDREKMRLVKEQNKNSNIKILFYEDLKKMNILI